MKFVYLLVALFGGAVLYMLLGGPEFEDTTIKHFAVDDETDLVSNPTRDPYAFDRTVTSDGNGSLRIDSTGQQLVNLYHFWGNEEDLGFRKLVYEADVRTEDVQGDVYLVMQAGMTTVPGGSMAVVGNDGAISGTHEWTTLEASAGNPAGSRLLETKLQLHIGGPGTVWIDDVRVLNRQTH